MAGTSDLLVEEEISAGLIAMGSWGYLRLRYFRYSLIQLFTLALVREPVKVMSNIDAHGVLNLGKVIFTNDGIATSFYVISAEWMRRFGDVSETAVSMRGGGRFYLATKPPTNLTWEPGSWMRACVTCACETYQSAEIVCW